MWLLLIVILAGKVAALLVGWSAPGTALMLWLLPKDATFVGRAVSLVVADYAWSLPAARIRHLHRRPDHCRGGCPQN